MSAECPRCGHKRLAYNDPTPYPSSYLCYDCEDNMQEKAESYGGTPQEIAARFEGYMKEWQRRL